MLGAGTHAQRFFVQDEGMVQIFFCHELLGLSGEFFSHKIAPEIVLRSK